VISAMWRKTLPLFVVSALVLAYLVGRKVGRAEADRPSFAERPVQTGLVLATFDGRSITADDFKAELAEQNPFNRQRFSSPEGRRELLDSMVRAELVAASAARDGYDRNPRVLADARKQMANRYLEERFSEAAIRQRLTDDDARRFYESHLEDYQRPARVRASLLLLQAPASDRAARNRRRAEAEALLSSVRKAEATDPMAFAAAVRRSSDDAETRAVDGDMRFLARPEMEKRWGSEIASWAFSLKDVGQISEVVERPDGFALLKLENVDPGQTQTFEESLATVKARAANEARTRDLGAFVERLKRESGLAVNEGALAGLSLDAPTASAASAAARLPGSGATTKVMPIPAGAPGLNGGVR
jgi:peptidyl-prolyl cis-trans isomerase C